MFSLYGDEHERGTPPHPANQLSVESSEPAVIGIATHVVVRLTDGDQVVAGTFTDADEARRTAEELLTSFSQVGATWPFVEGRYLRPEAVVSIDLVEEEHRRWGGSADRRKSMEDTSAADDAGA